MQLIYDHGMLSTTHEGQHYFYSPANHVRVMVNEYAAFLIEEILSANGNVNLQQIVTSFRQRFDITLSTDEILEQIERLIKMNLFFYSESEFIKSRKRLLDNFEIHDKVPDLVYLLLTYRCNFDCSYCYLRDANKDITELTTEQWIEGIRKLKDLGVRNFCVTGGEALVRDDIVQILQEIKKDGAEVNLLTNGSLLPKLFTQIDPLIDHLVISLDSFDYECQSATRSDSGFAEILQAIELYSQTNPDKLKVRAVITKNNLAQMNEFTHKLNQEYGIKTIRSLVNPITPEEVDLVPEVAGKIALDQDILDTLNFNMKYRKCGACHSVMAVNPAGDIQPCQAIMHPEFKMTNLFEENWFQEFLKSDVRNTFTSLNLDKMETCKDCSYRYLCGGSCPAISYNIYGDLTHHVPFFCDYLKEKAHNALIYAKANWQAVD